MINNKNQISSSHIKKNMEFSSLSIENDYMKSLFYEEMIKEYVSRKYRGKVLQICVKKSNFLGAPGWLSELMPLPSARS